MREFYFGSLDRRQLHIRLFAPHVFQEWAYSKGFYLAPRKLLSLRAWWSAIFARTNWSAGCRRFVGTNHRCYCDCGCMIDGHVKIAGFQVQWFYSHFIGYVPCWCDQAIEELNKRQTTGGHGQEANTGSEALPPASMPTASEIAEAYHTGDGA